MECIGSIRSVMRDFDTNNITVTLSLSRVSVQELQNIKAEDKLSISMKKWRAKRSLDANGYLWAILTEIANHHDIKSSSEEIYEEMLQKYGVLYKDDDGYITITVHKKVDMSKIDGHWKWYKEKGDFVSYLMIKGTSEYDTKEMAHFIDCVVEEAKTLGIETATPDELARMKQEWKE